MYLLLLRIAAGLMLLMISPCHAWKSPLCGLTCPVLPEQFGRTPLFSASYVGREDVMQALLRAGAAVDCTDKVSVRDPMAHRRPTGIPTCPVS